MNAHPLLRARALRKSFPGLSGRPRELFDEVNFSLNPGELLSVRGRSGSGKSTLLKCLVGLEPPNSGEVFVGQSSIYARSPSTRARLRCTAVGYVPQSTQWLFEHLTVLENVELTLLVGQAGPPPSRLHAQQQLEEFGLDPYAAAYPKQLSGGERRRLLLARSLVLSPDVLVADEPFSGLDSFWKIKVEQRFSDLLNGGGAVVLSAHERSGRFSGSTEVYLGEPP